MSEPFRWGIVPGATPGKWVDTFKERMPRRPLELVHLTVPEQYDALMARGVDVALARLPLDDQDLHQIRLYEELPVVVANRESHLLAADELTWADLEGEVLLQINDGVFENLPTEGLELGAQLETAADAIATVGAGVGIAIVPMSIARANQRKDTEYRVLTDGPTSQVVLAWPKDNPHELVDTVIGIVRGRTARSSRG